MIAPMIDPTQPDDGGGNEALPAKRSWARKPPTKEPTMPSTIVAIQPIGSRPGIKKRAMTPTIAPKMIQVTIAVRSMYLSLPSVTRLLGAQGACQRALAGSFLDRLDLALRHADDPRLGDDERLQPERSRAIKARDPIPHDPSGRHE